MTREEWKTIYNHWDGYPEYLGKMLKDHYKDKDKVEKLIDLGDLDYVGEKLGKKHKLDYMSAKRHPNWTTTYSRDGNESNTEPKVIKTLDDIYKNADEMGEEYVYLFDDGKWEGYEVQDKLVPLKKVDESIKDVRDGRLKA